MGNPLDTAKFVQAKNYTAGRTEDVGLIVLHTPETPETATAAEGAARYFQHGIDARGNPTGSTQGVVDADSEVRCVRDTDCANGAKGGGINKRAVHLEIAGVARQSADDWRDSYSRATLTRAALIVAHWCIDLDIVPRHLTDIELRGGLTGIVGHGDVTRAYKVSGGHTDPGNNFPWERFITLVAATVHSINSPSHPEVQPMFNPPLQLANITAELACPTGGTWLLGQDGAVFAFGGAPYHGGANGAGYFQGRKAARLEAGPNLGGYSIVASTGEKYSYPL